MKARVLFVGDDWYGSNATSLRNAVLRRGHDCLTVQSGTSLWHARLVRARVARSGLAGWNDQLLATARAWSPDVTLVFKGVKVSRAFVEEVSGITVHYHPDDSSNPTNRSGLYDEAESSYDLHVTTKSFNVPELKLRGSPRVLYMPCAYDRDWHRPVRYVPPRYTIGFIGTRRGDRADLIRSIAVRCGKMLRVCGAKWHRDLGVALRASVAGPRYGLAMSQAIREAPIQLGLLNSANRDLHTCRSFEVPAAGGLLLAERTPEHSAMFAEGSEALLFSSGAELEEHICRLEARPALAVRIAAAGRVRVRGENNTYEDRWDRILTEVGAL